MLEQQRREETTNNAALIAAVKKNGIAGVSELIRKGVDINRPDPKGYTALHYAAKADFLHLAAMLIDNHADRDATTREGTTPIMLAASKRRAGMVELLAGYRIDTSEQANGATARAGTAPSIDFTVFKSAASSIAAKEEADRLDALTHAVTHKDIPMAARIIAAGNINLNELDQHGNTPLILAATYDDVEMIRLLLCCRASINVSDDKGRTPLMHAVAKPNIQAITALLRAGADTTHIDIDSCCALDMAVANDDTKVLDVLLGEDYGSGKLHGHMPFLIRSAAKAGKVNTVRMLLAKRADLPDASGSHALAAMAQGDEVIAVRTLLAAGADPHHKAWDGHTAFILAAANGHERIVKALFDHCPAPYSKLGWIKHLQNEIDNQGRTALMLAVLNRQHKMTDLLLEQHADPHKTDHLGRNAILWAAAKGNECIAISLIGHRARHTAIDKLGNTVYLAAAEHGNAEIIKLFCRPIYTNTIVTLNSPNKEGDTPLIMAARNGHLDVVMLLLERGANLLRCNNAGRSALLESAAYGHMDVLAVLQERERALPKRYPVIPVMNAVYKAIVQAIPVASYLLPELQPAQTRQTDKAGNSLMHLLASNGHEAALNRLLAAAPRQMALSASASPQTSDNEAAELFLAPSKPLVLRPANLDIESLNKEGMTPLCMAARQGHYSMVKLLLEQGAQVNHVSNAGSTPLWLACRIKEGGSEVLIQGTVNSIPPDREDLVSLLLSYGARPDQVSFRGQTPLNAAATAGDFAVVMRLLEAGADIDHADEQEITSLMYASHFGHSDVVKILLDRGASPDPRPGTASALIVAAERGHDAIVKLLVARGAQTNHVDEYGATALINASGAGKLSTVKLLIKLGADLRAQNNFGRNAINYASLAGHDDVVQALREGYPESRDC